MVLWVVKDLRKTDGRLINLSCFLCCISLEGILSDFQVLR